MKFTLKENVNLRSVVLKHNVVLDALNLLEGREGSLKTEREIYTMIAMANSFIEEDLTELCNDSTEELIDIVRHYIEPFVLNLIEKPEYNEFYQDVLAEVIESTDEFIRKQETLPHMIMTFFDILGSLTPEQKTEMMNTLTSSIKEQNKEKTAKAKEAIQNVDEKIQKLMEQYKVAANGNTENSNK